jgi:hypothetical protein
VTLHHSLQRRGVVVLGVRANATSSPSFADRPVESGQLLLNKSSQAHCLDQITNVVFHSASIGTWREAN